jgi:hypothetical protein
MSALARSEEVVGQSGIERPELEHEVEEEN